MLACRRASVRSLRETRRTNPPREAAARPCSPRERSAISCRLRRAASISWSWLRLAGTTLSSRYCSLVHGILKFKHLAEAGRQLGQQPLHLFFAKLSQDPLQLGLGLLSSASASFCRSLAPSRSASSSFLRASSICCCAFRSRSAARSAGSCGGLRLLLAAALAVLRLVSFRLAG